jgi:HK97 family phage major capsid protein/HK97 family phage prohead protease
MNLNNRAYSLLEIKGLDEERREITGIATTPEPDRVGDIVEPMGAKFAAQIPLLWQHQHDKPVGVAEFGKPTKSGIPFKASLPIIGEDGPLKQLVDMAWQAVKAKLVRGVSIGFRPIEYNFIENGGVRFSESEIYELSLVTIPANASATIHSIKSIDSALRAATGNPQGDEDGRKADPGVTGMKKETGNPVVINPKPKGKTMNVKEQIDALDAKRKELADERTTLQSKAVSEGRTKDAAEQERFDEITSELGKIDKEISDLRVMEKDVVSSAAAVQGQTQKAATESRQGHIQVRDNRVRGEGIAVAQMCKQIFKAQGNLATAQHLAEQNKDIDPRVAQVLKTAVAAGTTASSAWGGFLVGDETSVYADFVEFLRPQTIIGRFGAGGVPSLRSVPFRTALISQTAGATGYWVGEGNAKPLTKIEGARTTLEPLKVANIAVITDELMRDSSPAADVLVRDQLVAALAARMDIDFIDPDKAAASGVSPGSITNGIAGISSTGSDADAIRRDIRALWAPFIAANNTPTSAVYIMSANTALAMSLMQNPLGQAEFPGLSMTGGTLMGVPVIVSEYATNTRGSAGGIVVLANASDIYFGDEGGFMVDMSNQASVQMDDNPDNPTTSSTVLVSLWQRNLVGFRAERTVNWARRRTTSVTWLDAVTWGT